jgi:Putative addiction module component
MALAQKKNQLAQKLLQTEDKHILKAIELLFSQEEESFDLVPAQKRELDKRLAEVESGKAKFYSIGEVKKIVRKNSKRK